MKHTLKSICIFLLVNLFAACGVMPSATIVVPTLSPSITQPIPSKTLTITPSPTFTFTATPDICNLQSQNKIQIISGLTFSSLTPGGPGDFDRILIEQNPEWKNFRQVAHGELRSAGIIFHETSLGPEWGTGVNPAVVLVTYGVERNWELPINGDLISDVEYIRSLLYQQELDWELGKVDQSQFPAIANAATFSLYHYFNGDFSKLETWCHTYVRVYGESPLRISQK